MAPLEYALQSPVLSPLRDRIRWLKKTQNKKKMIGVFIVLPSVKLGGWSLLPSLSLFEGRGLSYYPQRTFIDLFFSPFFTMCLYCQNGLSEGASEPA